MAPTSSLSRLIAQSRLWTAYEPAALQTKPFPTCHVNQIDENTPKCHMNSHRPLKDPRWTACDAGPSWTTSTPAPHVRACAPTCAGLHPCMPALGCTSSRKMGPERGGPSACTCAGLGRTPGPCACWAMPSSWALHLWASPRPTMVRGCLPRLLIIVVFAVGSLWIKFEAFFLT